jgi:protein involved in polysaccharide export with SLBB domain
MRSRWVSRSGLAAVVPSCLGVVLIAHTAGCADHRISLATFLEMQEELNPAPMAEPATSQPTTTSAPVIRHEIAAMIDRQLGPYKVGVSDVLGVSLTTTEPGGAGGSLPIQVRVDREGKIALPMVGKVKVVGMELGEVEEAIREAYVPKYYRDAVVFVQLTAPDQTNVLVHGAVSQPGLVKLRRTERNLFFAIAGAGGVSDLSSGEVTLRRIRRPEEEVTLRLTDPQELKAAIALDPLENGDILRVHAAQPNTVFVGGLVNAPRPEVSPPGTRMTILQAIAGAGGLRTDVTPREATLIRRMPDGRDVHVKLDLDRLTTGKDQNIELAAGDILWVPETLETKVQNWCNQNLFFRAGVGVNANVAYDATAIEYMNNNAKMQAQQGYYNTSGQSSFGAYNPFGSLIQNSQLQSLLSRPVSSGVP